MCVRSGSGIYSIKYQRYMCQMFAGILYYYFPSPWIDLLERLRINYGGSMFAGRFEVKVFPLIVRVPVIDLVATAALSLPARFDRNVLSVIVRS